MINIQQIRADLEATLPPLIARKNISTYTGGLYSTKTMEVYDCKGIGVKDPVRLANHKIAYTKENLINWLISRLEAADDNANR